MIIGSKKKLIIAEHKEEKDIEEEAEMDEGRRRGSDVIEEFLVWQPAPTREHSSERFEPGKLFKSKKKMDMRRM